ncbi:hypothetical protein BDP27DRAFT_220176 [Rhodocollybia butyracea]|uniref:DUF7907 domain-containing protein n=1 Tax=Rhodocollybia butyracea TaxID=206335 RepID=A0A9P5UCH9_9AGAR|nr:hypothetical protein BDP27DRAFT_220176 [Rhodocollybia butyracea]
MRWHEAEIVEAAEDDRDGTTLAPGKGSVFDEAMVSGELVTVLNAGEIEERGGGPQFGGWMVCEWKWGHPQLFWLRKSKDEGLDDVKLPPFCERVVLVKEALPEGVQDQAPENRV